MPSAPGALAFFSLLWWLIVYVNVLSSFRYRRGCVFRFWSVRENAGMLLHGSENTVKTCFDRHGFTSVSTPERLRGAIKRLQALPCCCPLLLPPPCFRRSPCCSSWQSSSISLFSSWYFFL